jgi:DNA-binding response OmpR family regulator
MLESLLLARGFAARVHDRTDAEPAQWVGSPPSLIVLSADVKNGFNLCLKFKKDLTLRRVPLILVTAKASPDVIRKHRLLPTRADAYLTKPLDALAFLKLLDELLPETSPDGGRDAEINVVDIPDNTLVSNGTLESAVVTYVEEEVRSLKNAVELLMTEKSSLGGKVVDLESQLRSQRQILDSGLERMVPRNDEPSGPAVVVESARQEPDEDEERFEAARKAGYEAGLEQGRSEKRSRGLEQGRREGRSEATEQFQAEREELESTIGRLELRVKEAERQLAEVSNADSTLRSELDQTAELFERLEGGYKDALAKAETERSDSERALARAEAERDNLAALLKEVKNSSLGHDESLAERDSHIAALEASIGDYRKRIEAAVAAGARVGELEAEIADLKRDTADANSFLETAREALADLEPLRQAEAALRTENDRLNARLQLIRDALDLSEETL